MSKKSVNFIVNEPLYRLAMLYSMYDVTTKRDLAHLFVNLLFDAEDDVLPNGKTIGKLVKASEKGFKEDRYLSTKISLKTAWQKYSFAGVKVFGKGITPEQLEKMIKYIGIIM